MKVSPKIICVIIIFLVIFHTKSNGQKNALPHSGTSWVGKLLRPEMCIRLRLPNDTIGLSQLKDSCKYYRTEPNINLQKDAIFTEQILQMLCNTRLYRAAYRESYNFGVNATFEVDSNNIIDPLLGRLVNWFKQGRGTDTLIGKVASVRGYIEQKKGNYFAANEFYWQTLQHLPVERFHKDWIILTDNIAQNYISLGDYRIAIDFSNKTLNLLEKFGPYYPSEYVQNRTSKAHRQIGWANMELEQIPLALASFYTSLKLAEPSEKADRYAFIARCYLVAKQPKEAKQYIELSHQLDQESSQNDYSVDIQHILARCALQNNEFELAKQLFFQEIPDARKYYGVDHTDFQKIYAYLAEIYETQQRPDSALWACQQVLNIYDPSLSGLANPPYYALKADYWILMLLAQKARLLEQKSHQTGNRTFQQTALESVQLAIRMQEALLDIFKNQDIKHQFTADQRKLYQQGIRLALALNNADVAYDIAQRAKAAILRKKIAQNSALETLPDSVFDQLKSLRNYLLSPDSLKKNPVSRADAQVKLSAIEQQINRAFPVYAVLQTPIQSLPVGTIQQQLPEDAAIFDYFVGEEEITLFTITRASFHFFKLPNDSTLQGQIAQLRSSVLAEMDAQNCQIYLESSRYCYQHLMDAAVNVIRTQTPRVQRLWIVPDARLHFLPFDALLTEPTVQCAGPQTPWLLRQFATGYAFSVVQFFPKNTQSNKNYVGWGIQYDSTSLALVNRELQQRQYGFLPKASEEVMTVARLMKGEIFLNQAATKASFMKQVANAGIVHLAMHALADSKSPDEGHLVFSTVEGAPENVQHQLLRVSEIYGLSTRAQLAVLSACSTADGALLPGEGVASLGRAFQVAGVQSVLMNQWSAEDNTSSVVVPAFFTHLKAGKNKDEALRLAKLDLLSDPAYSALNTPVFWAGYVVSGNMGMIKGDNLPEHLFWWIAALLVFGGVMVGVKKANYLRRFSQG